MRRGILVLLGVVTALAAPGTRAQTTGSGAKLAAPAKAIHLPLFFEANQGQADSRVKFMARSKGYTLLLSPTETVLAESKTQAAVEHRDFSPFESPRVTAKVAAGSVIRMQLVGANAAPTMTGLEELPGKVNYLIGNDPSKWHTGVALYSQVGTKNVYPGVDLLFHGDAKELEYDFVVAPGADPSKIAFRISGAERMQINERGDLVLHTADSDFLMRKPVIYQTIGSERRPVEGSFVKKGKHEVAFRLGAYDHAETLVIDPAIAYATFLGGASADMSGGFAVDDSTPGSPKLYLGGFTLDSTTFSEANTVIGFGTSTTAPFVEEVGFVAKIDPTASGAASLNYLTFMGGNTPTLAKAQQQGCASAFVWLALDKSQGAANIVPVLGGVTSCNNFPSATVLNPVTDPTGTNDGITTVALRMMPSGKAIDKAVVLGGQNNVEGGFVAVGTGGNVILSGETQAQNLPTKNAYVNSFNNGDTTSFDDCWVGILNRADLSINYMTYLNAGGGSTSGTGVGCGAFQDSSGNILAGGNTVSPTIFNLGPGGTSLANGFQTTFKGTIDTFAIKLDTSKVGVNQLEYATYFAGGGETRAANGSFDLGNGVVAIVGGTTSNTANGDIPLKNAFQTKNNATGGGMVGFLVLLNTLQTGAPSLQAGTYFGGTGGGDIITAVTYDAGDPSDYRIILGGRTTSPTDFPTLNPIQPYVGAVVAGTQSPDAFLSILRVPTPAQTAFNATLVFSTYLGGSNPPAQVQTVPGGPVTLLEDDAIRSVAVDASHTIYAAGESDAPGGFFANTNPTTTVGGFQTTCASCNEQLPQFDQDDVVVFSLGTGTNATLQSIAVAPTSASIAVGATQQFRAVGNFSDGTEKDITSTVTWTTVPTGFATMSTTSPGLATGTAAGSTAVTPSLGTATVLNTGALTVTGGAVATHFSVTAPANATAGTQFNITVTALDANNQTVTSYTGTVHFTSSDAQAVLPGNSALLNGVTTLPVVLHTAGAQTITATDTVTASITGVSGTITVAAATGAALAITKSGPANVASNTPAHYTIVVTNNGPDAATGVGMSDPIPGDNNIPGFDAAVPGCFISHQIESTTYGIGCSFSSPLASGASITIPYHVTYAPNGSYTNTATVSGTNNTNTTNNSASVTTNVGTGGVATHFMVTAPATATSGTPFSVTVTALDATNATATGYTGTVHFTSSDGQAVLPANGTLTNGTGTFSATLKTTGAQTITATDTVTASITGTSGAITVSGAPATHFSVAVPTNVTGGTSFNITVTALDASNARAFGYTGVVHFTSTDSNAVLPVNSTLTNGSGTLSVTLNTTGAQTITATDTVTATITGTSGTITVAASAVATHFMVSASITQTAGVAFNVAVSALDASNAIVTGYTGTVHFTSSDGAAVLPANSTLTNGTGNFSVTLNTLGSQTITATDTVTATITGTSSAITVSSAAATHFSVTAPASATSGTAFNFTVTALDALNHTATSYAGTAHFTSTDGAATLPANSTLTNGVGMFSATLNTVGNQTITATDTVTASITGTSGTINVTAVAAPQLVVQTAGTGTGTVTGNGINCTSGSANGCTVSVSAGTQVTLTAMPGANSTFTSWSAICESATTTCSFTMPATTTMVTATFTLNAPTLKSIAVTPANPTEPINSSLQFHATGTFSDNSTKDITNDVGWSSSNGDAATISESGLATTGSTADLSTTISAQDPKTEIIGSTTLTVSNSPISVVVTPPIGGTFPPVPPGGKLAVGIVLTATEGFSGTVTFGCSVTTASGAPAPSINCVPDPASVNLTPNGPTQVAFVVNTFCTGSTNAAVPNPGGFGGGLGLFLLGMTLGGTVWMYRRKPRLAISFAVLVLFALGGVACSSLPKGANGATPPGDYQLTVTATTNGTTSTTQPIPFTVE